MKQTKDQIIKNAVDQLLAMFRTGKLPKKVAFSIIHRHRGDVIPSDSWSIGNRIERYDQLFVLYEVQTTIFDAEDHIVAEGLGSCNSKERKYQRTDFATNLNTILKMAKKRSYVDAVLTATHASGVFTQDIEDIGADLRPVVSKEA